MIDKYKIIIVGLALLLCISIIYLIITKIKQWLFMHNLDKKVEESRERAKRRKITAKDKEYVLKRDNYTCQICGISKQFFEDLCPGSSEYLLLEIDHIKSVANGGYGSDTDNLQVLCWKCNRKKGGKKSNEDISKTINYGIKYLQPTYKKWYKK